MVYARLEVPAMNVIRSQVPFVRPIVLSLASAAMILAAMVLVAPSVDAQTPTAQAKLAKAIFAGGCFWCMEHPFDELDGVVSTTSGYVGGHKVNPTYHEVSSGTTGHAEAVQVVYDPTKVSYEKLLEVFWVNIDPTDAGGQFCDRGSQYRTGIFYETDEQKRLAEASKAALAKSKPFKEPIVTEITKAGTFYPAEDYHQDYYIKNPVRYKFYRTGCGRDARLKALWGKAPA
jgi:peptide-methionine (S)-S-oxide reductase